MASGNIIQKTINPGSSSTVPGARPRALVYKHTNNVNYEKLADFVRTHLSSLASDNIKIAVLCDWGISAIRLKTKLKDMDSQSVSFYDGGVQMFDQDGSPVYREDTAEDRGEAELTE